MGTFVGLFCCLDGRLVYSSQQKKTSKQNSSNYISLSVIWYMNMPLVAKKKKTAKKHLDLERTIRNRLSTGSPKRSKHLKQTDEERWKYKSDHVESSSKCLQNQLRLFLVRKAWKKRPNIPDIERLSKVAYLIILGYLAEGLLKKMAKNG